MAQRTAVRQAGGHAQDLHLHPCPIYGGQRINEVQCNDQNRIIAKNRQFCNRIACMSPWRLCIFCLEQGVTGQGAIVANAVLGLCEFHRAHGPGANRSNPKFQQAKAAPLADGSAAPLAPAPAVHREPDRAAARRALIAAAAGRAAQGDPALELPARPAPEPVADEGEVLIERELIDPNPNQPRKYFDPVLMRALTASIAEMGQVDPIIVVKNPDVPGRWMILKGERRYRACTTLGIKMMKAVIRVVADARELYRQTAVTDLGHVSYTHQEKALAIHKVMQDFEEANIVRVARMVALPVAEVYRHLSLFKLHPEVWTMMSPEVPEKRRLGFATALQLAGLSHALQLELAREIIARALNIRESHFLIRQRAVAVGERSGVGRKRKPVEDYKLLRAFLRRLGESAQQFTAIAAERFPDVFSRRDPGDLNRTIQQFEEHLVTLNGLLESLRAIQRARGTDD